MNNKYETQKEEMANLLTKFKNNEVKIDELVDKLLLKTQLPNKPYFRNTKSRAVALYGIKRDPLVLYRHQWMRLSRVFSGGKDCTFNKYFFNEEITSKYKNKKDEDEVENVKETNQENEVDEFLNGEDMENI